jgi:uncharacterized protein
MGHFEMKLLRADQRIAVPWKNGGGLTHEVAVYPANASWTDFEWRISIAAMTDDQPFSTLPDIDRKLAVLEGAVQLTIDGEQHPVQYPTSPPIHFDGSSTTAARVAAAPALDLNLMVRRHCWAGRLEPLNDGSRTCDKHCHLIVVTAPMKLGKLDLQPLDAFQIDPGETLPEMPVDARGWIAALWPVRP